MSPSPLNQSWFPLLLAERVSALEATVAEGAAAKADVDAKLEKFRRAATHWKKQFDDLKGKGDAAAPAPS